MTNENLLQCIYRLPTIHMPDTNGKPSHFVRRDDLLTLLAIKQGRQQVIEIRGTMPTFNELIVPPDARPRGRRGPQQLAGLSHLYSSAKKRQTERVSDYCHGLAAMQGLCDFEFDWIRPDRRTDKDNIMFAQKFIFDGLQRGGVIANDGWQQVGNLNHRFSIDPKRPRIIVTMTEVV